VGAALSFAHEHEPPVVHRDVSPSNLLLEDRTGRVVVMDFGIAKVAEAQGTLTETGAFLGKVQYAAPEHLRGERDVDARADIYSLGMVIYEMFTGTPFFAGCDVVEVMHRVVGDAEAFAPELASAPEALARIVSRAIAKDRGGRYQTVAEVVRDLN